MANPKATGNELENNGDGMIASLNTYQKRAPAIPKDIAPKDAQNKNMGVVQNSTKTSAVLGERANVDATKSAESRRTVPECPPTNLPSKSRSFAMPHPQKPIRSHDINFGLAPASSSVTVTVPSATTPSVPVSLISPANPRTSIESNHRDYIKRLLSMTPTELSKHAVELEKRSMQITRAANREINRKAALDINLTQQPLRAQQGASHCAK